MARRHEIKLMIAAIGCASLMLQAQPQQAPAQAQGQGRAGGRGAQPPGQASDEDNKNVPDGVKAD